MCLIPTSFRSAEEALPGRVVWKLGGKDPGLCSLKSVSYRENMINNSFSIFSPSFSKVLE